MSEGMMNRLHWYQKERFTKGIEQIILKGRQDSWYTDEAVRRIMALFDTCLKVSSEFCTRCGDLGHLAIHCPVFKVMK